MGHFSLPNSIPIFWLHIPTVYIRYPFFFHFWQMVWRHPGTLGSYYYYYFNNCSHTLKLMVTHWSFSDSRSTQVSRTLLIPTVYIRYPFFFHFWQRVWRHPGTLGSYYYYYYYFNNCSHTRKLMVTHWGFSDSRSTQVSRTLLSILVDLDNAAVWIVSTRLNSKSSSPYTNPFVTVPCEPITTGVTVTLMFHSDGSLFLWFIIRAGHLVEIRWSVYISIFSLYVSLSRTDSGSCL